MAHFFKCFFLQKNLIASESYTATMDEDVKKLLQNIPRGRPKSGQVWKADRLRTHRWHTMTIIYVFNPFSTGIDFRRQSLMLIPAGCPERVNYL